jgi:predicted metalloendopeptidase
MAHTNPHSPPRWRVDGVIVDQPEFGTVWSCEPGTPMNPPDRCEVW